MSNAKTIEKISFANIGKRPVVILPIEEYEEMKNELEMFRFMSRAESVSAVEDEAVNETAILEWAKAAKKQKKSGKLGRFHDLAKKDYPAIAKKYGIA
jgi:hypothetical protein